MDGLWNCTKDTILHTLRIGCGGIILTAALDNCSDKTYCNESTYKRLPKDILIHEGNKTVKSLPINTLSGETTSKVFKIVIKVKAPNGKDIKLKVQVVKPVLLPECKSPNKLALQSLWPSLDPKIVAQIYNNRLTIDDGHCDLLIGLDNYYKIVSNQTLIHHSGEYAAIHTLFGWSLGGNIEFPTEHETLQTYFTQVNTPCSEGENSDQMSDTEMLIKVKLEKFFSIDEDNDESELTYEELYAENSFLENIRYRVGERVMVSPLIKPDAPRLTNNFHFAMARFNGVKNSLQRNPVKDKLYREAIKQMLDNHEIEKVDINVNDAKDMTKEYFFLPHHAVINESKETTKCRIVFNGSAKDPRGISLNDTLLPGKKLHQDIPKVVNGFRKGAVAIQSDLRRMFYQVLLDPSHRHKYRFLWSFEDQPNPLTGKWEPEIYQYQVLSMGLKDSPYLAMKTIKYHVHQVVKEQPELENACKVIDECLFVDDLITSVATTEDAIALRKKITYIFDLICMKITKWCSNNKKFLQSIPADELSAATEVVLKKKESLPKPESMNSEENSGKHGSSVKNVATKKTKKKVLFKCDQNLSNTVSTGILNPEFVENSESTAEINDFKDDHLTDAPEGASLLKNETGTKTLGLNWNPLTDTFNFKIYKDLVKKNPVKNTKRGISSLITQWWDILGFAEPFKFAGKLILQRCWQTQGDGTILKWDDIIPTDILNDWEQWKRDVEKVAEMEIPRYIFEGLEQPPRTIFLHGFSDGGLSGYGVVIYIRFFNPKTGRFTCRIIYSASRVAPNNKPLSIPRKELAAATLLVECILKLAEEWKVPKENVFLHCDSKVVLNWIKQDKDKQTVWVRNRIAKIQQSTFSFFWTPGHKNPADFVSKFTATKRYVNNVAWTEGPEYLKDPKEVWKNEYSATLLAETSLSSEELRFINEEKREKQW